MGRCALYVQQSIVFALMFLRTAGDPACVKCKVCRRFRWLPLFPTPIRFLIQNPGHLWDLFQTLIPLLFFWQLLPLLAARLAVRNRQQVKDSGNRWKIGRYSEQDVRWLAGEATADLPDIRQLAAAAPWSTFC